MWSRLPKPAVIADACGRAVRRSLPGLAAVAVAASLTGGAYAGYRWVTRSARFAITDIAITGAHRVDADELRAQLPVHAGDNVFIGLAAARRQIMTNPWVAAVEVRRILPHTIAIELREHVPAAIVELGELYLVDPAGIPFKRAQLETGEAEQLPIITGIGRAAYLAAPDATATTIREALAAVTSWRAAARPAIGEVHVDPHGAITLHTYDQAIAIQLGALGAGLPARMHRFDTAWAGLSDDERTRARAIHLDARPDHVTVAFAKD